MPLIALLSPAPDAPLQPLLTVAGLPLVERQARSARLAGASRVLLLGAPLPGMEALPGVSALAAQIADDDLVLVLTPGLVASQAIVAAVVAAAPALGGFADRGVERIDATAQFAGVAVYPGALVRRVAAGLGDWDLHSTLLRTAVAEGLPRVDLDAVASQVWAVPATAEAARGATVAVLALDDQDGCGWPARYLHPPIQEALVRQLAPTPVTPDMADLLTVAIALAAGAAFACGWLLTGLALVLAGGPLRGVGAHLTRARLEVGRLKVVAPVAAAMAEYGWYLALAAHFAVTRGVAPWLIAALIILGRLAETAATRLFRRMSGRPFAEAGALERRLSLVACGRETNFWTLLPFGIAGAWYAGLSAVAALMVLGALAVQWRVFARLGNRAR